MLEIPDPEVFIEDDSTGISSIDQGCGNPASDENAANARSERTRFEHFGINRQRSCIPYKNVGVMADTIAMIVDMQKEIDQQASEYVIAKREALRLLERLPPASATILIKRFFEGQTVLEIGEALFITKRQAQRRIERAMTEFQHVLDESEKTTE